MQLLCWVRKLAIALPIFFFYYCLLKCLLIFHPKNIFFLCFHSCADTQIDTYVSTRRTRGLLHKLSGIASMMLWEGLEKNVIFKTISVSICSMKNKSMLIIFITQETVMWLLLIFLNGSKKCISLCINDFREILSYCQLENSSQCLYLLHALLHIV